MHAELALALRVGVEGISGETVYVARVTRAGLWALAKPCARCIHVLSECGVKRVVWTVGEGEEGEARLW